MWMWIEIGSSLTGRVSGTGRILRGLDIGAATASTLHRCMY
jgi:hypothetical protein